jgi:hypothetical protein
MRCGQLSWLVGQELSKRGGGVGGGGCESDP